MSSIKEKFIQAGTAISANRVICIGITGKAHHASFNSGAVFGISMHAANVNTGVPFARPGMICKVTAGGTVTGGDMCYVDNTGSGMVVKWAFTGDNWLATTGGSIAQAQQLRDMNNVVGTCLDGAVSGSTFWIMFNPIL